MKIEIIKDKQVKIRVGGIEYTIQESGQGLRIEKFDLSDESQTLQVTPYTPRLIYIK